MQPGSNPTRIRGEITGWHVLMGLLLFFGLVFAVNGWFLYSALSTYTGVVSNEPYRKGLAYNERISADERQHQLGWAESLSLADGANSVVFTLSDRTGSPVTGLEVRGMVGRPSTVKLDKPLQFVEDKPGHYAAEVAVLDSGTWLADINALRLTSKGEEIVWRSRHRLWVKPR